MAEQTHPLTDSEIEKLRTSERLFHAVFDGATDAMLLMDDHGVYTGANPSACALFGLDKSKLLGRKASEFSAPGYEFEHALGAFLEAGRLHGRLSLQRPDGSDTELDFTATANILPGLHLSVLRDMTDQKHTERMLRESQAALEEAQAVAHLGSWVTGVKPSDSGIWSRECLRIFGIEESRVVNRQSFLELVHPDDVLKMQHAFERATNDRTSYEIELRVIRADAEVRWVHERGVFRAASAGGVDRMVGITQDITERRRAIEELRTSEQRYRRIIETMSEGIWMIDADSNTTFMNLPMTAMLGYSLDEVLGRSVFSFMEDAARVTAEAHLKRRREGASDRYSFRCSRKNGPAFWVSMATNALRDDKGEYEGALAVATDISDQRHAEEVRNRLASIVESSDDAIMSRDVDGTIVSWNGGAQRLFGYGAGETIGTKGSMLLPIEGLHEEAEILQCVARGEKVEREAVRHKKDRSVVAVSLMVCPIRDAEGNVIGASEIARDLTEKKRTEEQLRQAQKMEAVGSLAGGIAHDFNNILSLIVGYTSIVLEECHPDDPGRIELQQVIKAAEKATSLVRQLLAFSRQQLLERVVIDVNQLVGSLERVLRKVVGKSVEIEIRTEADLGRINADARQIEQVIMNLVVNGRDAMPHGGKLLIEVANAQVEAQHAIEPVGIKPGRYVKIAVTDTGTGMDANTRARIFEPFFTTKELGKGTGLGLAMVLGIVQQSDGHVAVASEPGLGATFTVYLPRTDRPPEPVRKGSATVMGVQGTETILLVEDEEQVRALTRRILDRNGYKVLEAQRASEAFAICEQYGAPIHMLLTDMLMPGGNGRQVAERVSGMRPGIKVLFMSGYTDDAMARDEAAAIDLAFLQKPFTPDSLARKVREVLNAIVVTPDAIDSAAGSLARP